MDVLIVSKTHMAHNACVGGILLNNGRFVRLLDENGNNQPEDTFLNIRDIWDIDFEYRRDIVPPHIEDIFVKEYRNRRRVKNELTMLDVLKMLNIEYWEGKIDNIFDGLLNWTKNGSGYISRNNLPNQSVGFWITDKDLTKHEEFNKIRFIYDSANDYRKITFVGFQDPVETIPSGTLIRVSLARWWAPIDADVEERCYLQLSGWYDLENYEEDIDLPF